MLKNKKKLIRENAGGFSDVSGASQVSLLRCSLINLLLITDNQILQKVSLCLLYVV